MDVLWYLLGYKKGLAGSSGGGGESGGSGGGSLPAGVYTETLQVKPPTAYTQKWFYFEGELYAASLPYTGGGNDVTIYKLVDGAWSEVVAKTSYGGSPLLLGPSFWQFIEYNGTLHIYCSRESTSHAKFTGNSVETYNNLPAKTYNANQMVVHNNTLKCYCYGDGWLYAWDESTDTWTQEAEIGSQNSVRYLYVIDGELYVAQSANIYKYADGVLTQIGALSSSIMVGQDDRYIYFRGSGDTYYSPLKKFDVTTRTETEVGAIRGSFVGWMEDGQLRCAVGTAGTAGSYSYLVSHFVEGSE